MGTLWQDVRYGGRMLTRSPGVTVAVVVILAVGIGATTVLLSLIDAVLLRPPPYEEPERLVYLYSGETNGKPRGGGETSFPNFADWKRQSTVFEQLLGRLRSLPGVHSATATDWTPAWGGGNFPRFRIEGYSPAQYRAQDQEGSRRFSRG